ncbi:hypothetical protein [Dactylosporangium sp. CA-092794]|uniref:hypothetical protein n=1 Tax=Dactylosporangium sp. CA-092794 TaxID=3239929 RepID=UPI003D924572
MLAELAGREFRFAVPGIPPVRLPRDRQSLDNIWKTISHPPAGHAEAAWHPAVWTALTLPTTCIPLTPTQGADRAFASVATVDLPNRTPVLAIVKVSFAAMKSRFAPPVVATASATVVSGVDEMAEQLEELFVQALPQARSAAQRSSNKAIWLGGGSTVAAIDVTWRTRIEAMGAAMGLRIEIVEDPARHVRDVEANLGRATPPAYMLMWRSMSRGAERLVDTFCRICLDGAVVQFDEANFHDALVEARLALIEHGRAEPPINGGGGRRPPVAGEERFYIKTGGSKAGDRLVEVADCGHEQWGGDARRKAPRALMGVQRLEGVSPESLFRCAKCSKHRWRARF